MRFALCLLFFITTMMPQAGARDATASAEIEALLRYVENSNVRFVRNGSEHDSKEAAAHLRDKLGKAGERVKTTEDFITGIGTKSYLSGQPYQVKLPDGRTLPSGPWLTAALTQLRAKK